MNSYRRFVDNLLGRVAPQTTAEAHTFSQFCYCSRFVAYRRFYYSDGTMSNCVASGWC